MTTLLGRGRPVLLWALALMTAALGYAATGLRIDHRNVSMNANDPELVATYQTFRYRFGDDEDLLLSVTHPGLLTRAGMDLVDEATRYASELDGVRTVYSLSTARELVPGSHGPEEKALIPRPATDTATVETAVRRNPELTGFLVSADVRTAGIVIELEDRPGDDAYRARMIAALRAYIDRHTGPGELHLTGIDVQKHDVTLLLQRDQRILIPAAVIALAAVLAMTFRRIAGVVLPLTVTGITLVWTLGCYALSGYTLNPVTSLLSPVIMVLAVSTSVHVYDGWLRHVRALANTRSAIRATVAELRWPCFFTALTTAFGMASLLLSDTPAVRQFGAFAALGIMLAFALTFTVLPVGLSMLSAPAGRSARRTSWFDRTLRWAARASTRHAGLVLVTAAILTLGSVTGIVRIRNNTDLVRFLRPDAPLYVDSMYIDRHLSGINALELMIARTDGRPLASLDFVQRLDRLDAALRAHPEVSGTQSLLSLLGPIQRATDGTTAPRQPATEAEALAAFDLLEAAGDDNLVRRLVTPDLRGTRVRVQVRATGTAAAATLVDTLVAAGTTILGPGYTVVPTGAFYQVARDSNRLVRTQVTSFSVALVLVMAAIGVMFRSIGLMLVALCPNLIPIFWTGGLMGFLGIDLSSGTAMIASVVIGLAVDDTIHYLAAFRRTGGTPLRAIAVTTTRTGRALVISSLVLVIGFWVGALGSFRPTVHFSLLTGITMISALLCDLLVLPALLSLRARPWTVRRRPVRVSSAVVALLLAAPVALAPANAGGEDAATTTSAGSSPPEQSGDAPRRSELASSDVAGEHPLYEVPIESRGRAHGTIAVLRRRDTTVLRILLHSKVLQRVVAAIDDKERASWPAGRAGHAASRRYIAALWQAEQALPAAQSAAATQRTAVKRDRRRALLIEFLLSETRAEVRIGVPELTTTGDAITITGRRPLARPPLPRTYVERNMALIIADNFALPPDGIAALLHPER